ncbi:hypothetical protein ANANG_G00196700 [Anguilla anguilla]|uniref:alcohol dehydrogenase (NADP(+)) n=1 Tax=Anguilla anguilla TaxID=7936 RepID=A0A9D3RVP3_ANGAN|nr:hypothetical protein ANANG_G00196700 [Anguilla anguilla]
MSCPCVTLSTGQKMPLVGLGTWKSAPGQVMQAVLSALDCGYRHIDCAAAYGNEQEVGEALRERVGLGKALQREDVFVTSKLWNTQHHPDDVEPACRKSLADLGLDYLDLYLMHWPMAFQRGAEVMPRNADGSIRYADTHYRDTWKAMEALVDLGLARAIGLSNFNARQVDDVLSIAEHKPAVNQVECHPYLIQARLLAHCGDRGVVVTAYSPLGSPDRPWATPGEPRCWTTRACWTSPAATGRLPPRSSSGGRCKEELSASLKASLLLESSRTFRYLTSSCQMKI